MSLSFFLLFFSFIFSSTLYLPLDPPHFLYPCHQSFSSWLYTFPIMFIFSAGPASFFSKLDGIFAPHLSFSSASLTKSKNWKVKSDFLCLDLVFWVWYINLNNCSFLRWLIVLFKNKVVLVIAEQRQEKGQEIKCENYVTKMYNEVEQRKQIAKVFYLFLLFFKIFFI